MVCAATLEHHATDHRRDVLRIAFSATFAITVRPRDDSARAAKRTAHFDLSIEADGVLSASDRAAQEALCAWLRAREDGHPAGLLLNGTPAQGPALWLLPGHLGNPLDLSLRTLRVLGTAQRVFVEPGSEPVVDMLAERYQLRPPAVVAVSTNLAVVSRAVQEGVEQGEVMALFGCNEGVPGLCDPGWRVLQVLQAQHPDVPVHTVSAGSALSTALLYLRDQRVQFEFWGLMQPESGSPLAHYFRPRLGPRLPGIFYAQGSQLRAQWTRLRRCSRGRRGRLVLMCNLTHAGERVLRVPLPLTAEPPPSIRDTDAIVVRVELDGLLQRLAGALGLR